MAQAAYVLLLTIHHAAVDTNLAKAQVLRLRNDLLKYAAQVKISVRRVLVQLPKFFPFAKEFCLISRRLAQPDFTLFA